MSVFQKLASAFISYYYNSKLGPVGKIAKEGLVLTEEAVVDPAPLTRRDL